MKLLTELIGDEQLLALTWKEPFGSLMLQGKIETRTWATNYRGWVLMCAGKQAYPRETVFKISGDQAIRINAAFGFDDQYKGAGYCGYAFAVGYLEDCRPMTKQDERQCYVEYYPDLYCHVYRDVQKIEPFQWRGTQGWKTVPPDILRQIKLL